MSDVPSSRVVGGRYVLLGEPGRAATGTVWRAEDRVTGRPVAVRELPLPAGLTPGERLRFRERLLRDARAAGRLRHPGIVPVHDVVSEDGVDRVVTGWVEAPTLAAVVTRDGPLDEARAGAVGLALVAALAAAHDRGLVHGDVHPATVLLADDGQVTLTELGIPPPPGASGCGTAGSPGYLAPERLAGGAATPAGDLWAVGATLHFAGTGAGPFDRGTPEDTAGAVRSGPIPAPPGRGPLAAVVGGLLRRDPADRLPAARAIAALSAASGTGAGGSAGRRRTGWWAAGVAAVALAVGLGAGALLARPGPAAATLTYGPGGDLTAAGIAAPACVATPPGPGRGLGARVDCALPHAVEVFAVSDPFGDPRPPHPGTAELAAFGAATCRLLFDSALVAGPDKDALEVTALVPAAGAFRAGGPVVCVLSAADGTALVGSRMSRDGG